MDLKQLVEAIDARILAGDVIGAFEQFAADQCITHSTADDVTNSKAQKLEGLRWFFSNVANINRIERPAFTVVGNNETHSQFSFDFTNHQGEQLLYNEVIRRVWNNGQLVEEQYLIGQTLAPAAPAKKATSKKAEAAADVKPAAAPAAKKATATPATKKEAPAKASKTAPKADDLTLVEGIGPKIAELLVANGLSTFADLAKAKPAAIKTILEGAGKRYQMHDPATWPKQAALARDGKTAELAKLQAELKGGK